MIYIIAHGAQCVLNNVYYSHYMTPLIIRFVSRSSTLASSDGNYHILRLKT
jgi:hypothetical protein